jgi:hypothetical protein
MRIRFDIDFGLSKRARAVTLGVFAALVLASGVVLAVPNVFKDGDTLSASATNQDFASVDSRLGAIETRITKAEALQSTRTADGGFSLGAVYCGASVVTTPGTLSGLAVDGGASYPRARAQCQQTCASASAHMCISDELARSVQLGIATGSGWFSAGSYNHPYNVANSDDFECSGWTAATGANYGDYWSGTPSTANCTSLHPILCCD